MAENLAQVGCKPTSTLPRSVRITYFARNSHSGEMAMTGLLKVSGALLAIVALLQTQAPADAITAELAKKCRAMAVKEHPTPRPGTKAGGQKAQNDFYRDCVAKDGKMDDQKK